MAETTGEMLARQGLGRYEISNYARSGFVCRHNLNYWRNGSYLGLGAGAVSCLSGLRLKNVNEPVRYSGLVQKGIPPFAEAECLSLAARFRESVIMGLRMIEGVSFSRLREQFGLTPLDYYGKILAELTGQDLIQVGRDSMWLTGKGLALANQVLTRLV
jgi:oxygen-independent coproporphyrinogen-3 oxidase